MLKLKRLVIIPALISGLVLTGCNENPSASIPPTSAPVTTPIQPSSTTVVEQYVTIDVKTPFSDKYSAEYDIESKLEEANQAALIDPTKRANDFCSNRIQEVTLDHYSDGDTITVNANCDGSTQKMSIRFYNVDTPETHHPEKGTEPWGMAASQYTAKRLDEAIAKGEKIIIQGGRTGIETTYERKVAYVWVGGRLLNLELCEIGLGTYGMNNANQEIHNDAAFDASWYRTPANGYRRNRMDQAMRNDDPNWDYSKASQCGSAPIETNVCIKDRNYKYDFQEIGPAVSE